MVGLERSVQTELTVRGFVRGSRDSRGGGTGGGYLERGQLGLVHGDTESTDFLLDRRQDGDDRAQGILVLTHEPPDVVDVLPGPLLVLGVVLDVLQSYVEYP